MAEETKKQEAVAEAPATTEAPAPATNPEDDGAGGLSVGDLKSIQGIIEVATNRGAFKAAELSAVGTIFDKLSKFLTSLDEQMSAQKEAEASEEKK
tara:strand:+ start:233 stop:520 length:288 start_codon:yes stop_codon:yes gene_type:complete